MKYKCYLPLVAFGISFYRKIIFFFQLLKLKKEIINKLVLQPKVTCVQDEGEETK